MKVGWVPDLQISSHALLDKFDDCRKVLIGWMRDHCIDLVPTEPCQARNMVRWNRPSRFAEREIDLPARPGRVHDPAVG